MNEINLDSISKMWDTHLCNKFPPELEGEEINGIDLVMLDADIAGCVHSILKKQPCAIPIWKCAVLGICFAEASMVCLKLSGESLHYFEYLKNMAQMALRYLIATDPMNKNS